MIPEEETRNEIADIIAKQIDSVTSNKRKMAEEEPPITARIAEKIDEAFEKKPHIGGYKVAATTTVMRSHGPKSWEKKTGVDLYVAIHVTTPDDPIGKFKGLIIQAKKRGSVDPNLNDQCRQIQSVSKTGGFVWEYDLDGARALTVEDVLIGGRSDVLSSPAKLADISGVGMRKHWRQIFECLAGDVDLADQDTMSDAEAVFDKLRVLRPRNQLAIELRKGYQTRGGLYVRVPKVLR